MDIDTKSYKALHYVYRHKRVTYRALIQRFDSDLIARLEQHDLLMVSEKQNRNGYLVPDPFSPVSLTIKGNCIVEERLIFTPDYVITQIVVPIIVGVAAAVITAIIVG